MKDRLMDILKKENVSYARFADIIDVQRSSISHILSGRNKPSFDFIQKVVIHFPKINAEWLITGKGEMYKSGQKQKDLFKGDMDMGKKPDSSNKSRDPETGDTQQKVTNVNNVKKIIVLYEDNSFEEFNPR